MAQFESLSSYLECSVCMETLKNPKCLPCGHMFCFKCLENQGKQKNKIPGDDMLCPLCRHAYAIPTNGFEGLRRNFVIEDMLNDLEKVDIGTQQTETKSLKCDACKKRTAWGYCCECEQHLCKECKESHGNLRLTSTHYVLSMEEKNNTELVFAHCKSRFCDQHSNEQLKLYCHDCSEPICPMCWPLKHQPHCCEDLKDVAKLFKEQIKNGYPKLMKGIETNKYELQLLLADKDAFLKEIKEKEVEIVMRRDELILLIRKQSDQLLNELEEFSAKRLKEIQIRKDEIETQLASVKSFQGYVGQLTEKGTPCDISRRATDVLIQTEAFVKQLEDVKSTKLGQVRLMFTAAATPASLASLSDETGLIGQLTLLALKGFLMVLMAVLMVPMISSY